MDPPMNNHDMYDDMESNIENRIDEALEEGSVVEVIIKGEPRYGLIKWIGAIPEHENGQAEIAGIELVSCFVFIHVEDFTVNGPQWGQNLHKHTTHDVTLPKLRAP